MSKNEAINSDRVFKGHQGGGGVQSKFKIGMKTNKLSDSLNKDLYGHDQKEVNFNYLENPMTEEEKQDLASFKRKNLIKEYFRHEIDDSERKRTYNRLLLHYHPDKNLHSDKMKSSINVWMFLQDMKETFTAPHESYPKF